MTFIGDGSAKETETVLGPIRELSGFSHGAGRRAPGWTSRQDPWTLERWPPGSLHHRHENGGSGAPRTPGSRTLPGWGSRLASGPHRGLSARKAGDNLRLDVPAVASITNPTPHAPRRARGHSSPAGGIPPMQLSRKQEVVQQQEDGFLPPSPSQSPSVGNAIDIRGPSCREVRRGELPASPGEEEMRLRGERRVPPCPTLCLVSRVSV